MPFTEYTARVLVDERDQATTSEVMNQAIDNLPVEGIPVFDSEVTSTTRCEVENEEQIRAEIEADKKKKK